VSCDPERVTAYVDDTLDAPARAALETHLAGCAMCRAQASFEQGLRSRPSARPDARPPVDPARRMPARLGHRRLLRPLLLAAAALGIALWVRGAPAFVAWELSLDHRRCFREDPVPAKVWSSEATIVEAWFQSQGTSLPLIPDSAAGLELVGARYCALPDVSRVAHLYYEAGSRHVSLYVMPRQLRSGSGWSGVAAGEAVRVLRVAGEQVILVGDTEEELAAFESALSTRLAFNPYPAS
jgi:anti-sigma factor RsiW